jgi:hypothetical protein
VVGWIVSELPVLRAEPCNPEWVREFIAFTVNESERFLAYAARQKRIGLWRQLFHGTGFVRREPLTFAAGFGLSSDGERFVTSNSPKSGMLPCLM